MDRSQKGFFRGILLLCILLFFSTLTLSAEEVEMYYMTLDASENCFQLDGGVSVGTDLISGTYIITSSGTAYYASGEEIKNILYRFAGTRDNDYSHVLEIGTDSTIEIIEHETGGMEFYTALLDWANSSDNSGSVSLDVSSKDVLNIDAVSNCFYLDDILTDSSLALPVGKYRIDFEGDASYEDGELFNEVVIHYKSPDGDITQSVERDGFLIFDVVDESPNISAMFFEFTNSSDNAGQADIMFSSCENQNPGDADGNGSLGISDAVFLINMLSVPGSPVPDPLANGDYNGDCLINSTDLYMIVNHEFVPGSPEPVECSCGEPEIIPIPYTDNTVVDSVVLVCSSDDTPFRVFIYDYNGDPIVNDASVLLYLENCESMVWCPDYTFNDYIEPDSPSDENGMLTYTLRGGGCDNDCVAHVKVFPNPMYPPEMNPSYAIVPVRSFDADGDLIVEFDDDIPSSICSDFNNDGEINGLDQAIFSEHFGHSCSELDPCDKFDSDFWLVPNYNLDSGDVVALELQLSNYNDFECEIDYLGFFVSEFGSGSGEETLIEEFYNYGEIIDPGEVDTVSTTYTIPNYGQGKLTVKFTTDCCQEMIKHSESLEIYKHCSKDSNECYQFIIYIDSFPVEEIDTVFSKPAEGWNIYYDHFPTVPVYNDDSLVFEICTPTNVDLGDTASVITYVWYDKANYEGENFKTYVVTSSSTGDANGDCIVDISDAVWLINYVFVPESPPPDPHFAGNVDCNEHVDISDAVVLINYVFIPGADPPCNADDMIRK